MPPVTGSSALIVKHHDRISICTICTEFFSALEVSGPKLLEGQNHLRSKLFRTHCGEYRQGTQHLVTFESFDSMQVLTSDSSRSISDERINHNHVPIEKTNAVE